MQVQAELLAAAVASFRQLGLGPQHVGIKVNSRKILGELLLKLFLLLYSLIKSRNTFKLLDQNKTKQNNNMRE